MYIKKIKIKNFRSIVDEKIECEKFNVFIGKNNHGKSNIFRALDWFFNGGDFAECKTSGQGEYPEVEIVFGDARSGLPTISDDNRHKNTIKDNIVENEIIVIRKVIKNARGRDEARLVFANNKTTGIDGALQDYLPKFRYINARDHADKHDGYKRRNVIGELLSDIVERVTQDDEFAKFKQAFSEFIKKTFKLEQDKISNKIKEYLNEQFDNTIKEFSLTLIPPEFEDLMKNFTIRLDDGVETKIDEKGDGVQRTLIIAMFRFLSEEHGDGNGKKTIFCIDEVENHLHVATQRLMVDSFYKMIEKGGQVFINTHSPVFMQSGEDRAIFKVEKSGNETKIEPQGEGDFHQLLYGILGGLPRDYLFPDNFLIVEGESEEIFFSEIIRRFYSDQKIQIVNAKSNSRVAGEKIEIERIFGKFENGIYKGRAVAILDKLNKNDVKNKIEEKLNIAFDESRLFKLDQYGIEDYYPKNVIDRINGFYDLLKDAKKEKAKLVSQKITKEEFEMLMPICHKALLKCFELVANPKKESHDIKTPENTKSRKKKDDDMNVQQMDFLK